MNEQGELVYLNEGQGGNNLIEVSSSNSQLENNSQLRSELQSCRKEIKDHLILIYRPDEADMPVGFKEPEVSFHDDVILNESSNTVLATYIATIYNVEWNFECTFEKTKVNDNFTYKFSDYESLNNGR